MKRYLIIAFLLGILSTMGIYKLTGIGAQAVSGKITTDRLTGNATIYSGACYLVGIFGETDGTNDLTITLYDHKTGAVGKIPRKIIIPGANYYGGIAWPGKGVNIQNGIYATISTSGTGAYWVEYRTLY